jgi:VanZ family protein
MHNEVFFLKKLLKWLLWLLPVIYMILVWVMSSMPSDAIVELPDSAVDHFIKESLHLIEFAILYILLVMGVLTTGRFSVKVNTVCAAIAILYGLTDEIHQSFYSYRSATVIDFVKDTTGVLVSYYVVHRKNSRGKLNQVLNFFK